jgi:hypothetical protein
MGQFGLLGREAVEKLVALVPRDTPRNWVLRPQRGTEARAVDEDQRNDCGLGSRAVHALIAA